MAWVEERNVPADSSTYYRDDYGTISWIQYYDGGVDIDAGDNFYLVWSVGGGGETEWFSEWYNHSSTKLFRNVYMPSMSPGEYSWRFKFKKPGEEFWSYSSYNAFTLMEGTSPSAPDKAANPSPAHGATEVDFSDLTLNWNDSDGADTYDVFMGPSGSLVEIASDIIPSTWIVDLSDVPKEQVIYWRVDAKNEAGTTTGDIWNFDARPSKPASPSPTDGETDVAVNKGTISWNASTPGPANTYDAYFRIQGDAFTKVVNAQNVLSWRSPYVILNIKDYNPATGSGLRSPQAGDVIYDGTDSYIIQFVVVGDLINVQYQAKLYAFRTSGPGGKSGGDILTNGSNVSVTLNDQWHFHGDVEEVYLPPDTTFEWRIDATNEFGTTTGDVWDFTTAASLIIQISYRLIPGGSGSGPYDYPPGIQGTDWEWTGENCVIAIKRLVAAANSKIWYEDI